MNRLTTYFDLGASTEVISKPSPADGSNLQLLWNYVSLVLGILAQPLLSTYQSTGNLDLSGFSARILIGIIIGIVIFPSVYRNSFDPSRNVFVQLCMTFASGIGWQSLLKTITQ